MTAASRRIGTGALEGATPGSFVDSAPGWLAKRPKILLEENGFLSQDTVAKLVDPHNLNSGDLQDIYQQSYDDFEEPGILEIQYEKNGQRKSDIIFEDKLYADEKPRILVSVKAVHAMHRTIAVLTRKLDNLLVMLRSCRHHYYVELTHLRDLLSQQALNKGGSKECNPTADHYAYFFNPSAFQDEVTIQLFQERLHQATGDLQQQLQIKTAEIRRLQKMIEKEAIPLEIQAISANREVREQLQDLKKEHEALQAAMHEKDLELEQLNQEVESARKLQMHQLDQRLIAAQQVEEEYRLAEIKWGKERKKWEAERNRFSTILAQNSDEIWGLMAPTSPASSEENETVNKDQELDERLNGLSRGAEHEGHPNLRVQEHAAPDVLHCGDGATANYVTAIGQEELNTSSQQTRRCEPLLTNKSIANTSVAFGSELSDDNDQSPRDPRSLAAWFYQPEQPAGQDSRTSAATAAHPDSKKSADKADVQPVNPEGMLQGALAAIESLTKQNGLARWAALKVLLSQFYNVEKPYIHGLVDARVLKTRMARHSHDLERPQHATMEPWALEARMSEFRSETVHDCRGRSSDPSEDDHGCMIRAATDTIAIAKPGTAQTVSTSAPIDDEESVRSLLHSAGSMGQGSLPRASSVDLNKIGGLQRRQSLGQALEPVVAAMSSEGIIGVKIGGQTPLYVDQPALVELSALPARVLQGSLVQRRSSFSEKGMGKGKDISGKQAELPVTSNPRQTSFAPNAAISQSRRHCVSRLVPSIEDSLEGSRVSSAQDFLMQAAPDVARQSASGSTSTIATSLDRRGSMPCATPASNTQETHLASTVFKNNQEHLGTADNLNMDLITGSNELPNDSSAVQVLLAPSGDRIDCIPDASENSSSCLDSSSNSSGSNSDCQAELRTTPGLRSGSHRTQTVDVAQQTLISVQSCQFIIDLPVDGAPSKGQEMGKFQGLLSQVISEMKALCSAFEDKSARASNQMPARGVPRLLIGAKAAMAVVSSMRRRHDDVKDLPIVTGSRQQAVSTLSEDADATTKEQCDEVDKTAVNTPSLVAQGPKPARAKVGMHRKSDGLQSQHHESNDDLAITITVQSVAKHATKQHSESRKARSKVPEQAALKTATLWQNDQPESLISVSLAALSTEASTSSVIAVGDAGDHSRHLMTKAYKPRNAAQDSLAGSEHGEKSRSQKRSGIVKPTYGSLPGAMLPQGDVADTQPESTRHVVLGPVGHEVAGGSRSWIKKHMRRDGNRENGTGPRKGRVTNSAVLSGQDSKAGSTTQRVEAMEERNWFPQTARGGLSNVPLLHRRQNDPDDTDGLL